MKKTVNIILPAKKAFVVNCSKCGKFDFRIAVLPQGDSGGGKIARIQCINCKNEYPIDTQGCIGGWLDGKQSIVQKPLENGNGKPC